MATDTERLDALGCSDTHCELRPAGRGGMGSPCHSRRRAAPAERRGKQARSTAVRVPRQRGEA